MLYPGLSQAQFQIAVLIELNPQFTVYVNVIGDFTPRVIEAQKPSRKGWTDTKMTGGMWNRFNANDLPIVFNMNLKGTS